MDKLDLNFSTAQKAPPRRGRRAPSGATSTDSFGPEELQDNLTSSATSPSEVSGGPVAPPRSRRTGGWADETLKSKHKQNAPNPAEMDTNSKHWRPALRGLRLGSPPGEVLSWSDSDFYEKQDGLSPSEESGSSLGEGERFQSPEHVRQDSEDEISAIPDLDDFVEEETSQIAKAPSVQVRRVATYKELDSDLLKHTSFATLDDVNLRLLTRRLNLEADLKEPDSTWTWDLLFTEVASDLNSAWEEKGDAVSVT